MSNIPTDGGEGLAKSNAFISDLLARRGKKYKGHHNVRNIELLGGRIVEPTAFEPDPTTHRGEYYYNATINVLFRRVTVANSDGVKFAHWVRCSN
jgi:hypothetical protein